MRGSQWVLLCTVVVGLAGVGGCSCGDSEPPPLASDEGDAGLDPLAGSGDGGTDAGTDGGDVAYECVPLGGGCAGSNLTCCQGVCAGGGTCEVAGQTECSGAGGSCNSSGDCCAGRTCEAGGTCSLDACRQTGVACSDPAECCTLTCSGGFCADLPVPTSGLPGGSAVACAGGATKVVGQACGEAGECCSGNCQGGQCVPASYCRATGDLCTSADDCCSGRCSSGASGAPGRCFESTGGCALDGTPCTGGTGCCSKICTDLGYGTKVCAPASGCAVTGNACGEADECCGGEPLGSVRCVDFKCNQGTACNEVGMVCGRALRADGSEVKVNAPAPNKCCGDYSNGTSCKLDSAGVPRCFGGGSPSCPTGYTGEAGCCIESAQQCRFSDQCCGGQLCLPSPAGVGYTCQGVTCAPVGASCDPTASGCCAGTECLPAGELAHACQVAPTGAGPGADAGTPDGGAGGVCKPNSAGCAAGSECCSGICSASVCQAPAVCQPQDGLCTSGADCCAGFQCVQGASGTLSCQPGGCSSGGQACTNGSQCCSGLQCLDASGSTCDGASACACVVTIG